jgi:transcriptional regulator with XRE-family HTH domain
MAIDHEKKSNDEELRIGKKLKELRMQKGFSLEDVSAVSGIEVSMLSQFENGEIIPPLATLQNLSKAFDIKMVHFFQDTVSSEKISVTRSHERVKIERRPHHKKGEIDYIYEALEVRKSDKHMEPFMVEIKNKDTAEMVFVEHQGEEFVFLLEGELEFRSLDRVEVLEPGDSIYFESDISHSFRCLSDDPAKAIIVLWGL